jgi:hypothetical protein
VRASNTISAGFISLEASILTAYNDAVKKALILLKEILNEKIPAR